MNQAKWLSLLTDRVRHLPTTASDEEVLADLAELQVISARYNHSIPLEYQAVYEAYAQYRAGELIPAMKQFFDCVAICHSHNQEYLVHFSWFCIGTIFGMLGDQFHASEFLTKAEKIHTFQDDILYALTKNNIGDLLLQYKKYDEALACFASAIDIVESINQPEFATIAYINSAAVYVGLNRPEQAQQMIEKVAPLIGDNRRNQGFLNQVRAQFFLMFSQPDQADQHYRLAIEDMAVCHNTHYQSEIMLEYCHFLLGQQRIDHFDQTLKAGLTLAKQTGADKLIDGYNDLLLERMEHEHDFCTREETYKLLLSSYQKSREATKQRETSYLKQLYQLNMDRLKLEQAQDISTNLTMVNNIGQYISTCDSFEDIIGRLSQDLSRLFIIDALAIAFYRPELGEIQIQHYYDEGKIQEPEVLPCGSESTFFEYCARHKRPLYFNNMTSEKKQQLLNSSAVYEGLNSLMFAPIIIADRVEAIFTIQARQCFAYQTFHYELFLQLSNYLSIALENQLNRQRLTRLSQTDHLTQLWNRQSLDIHFADMLLSPPERLSVLMIDIDCYKQFNDHYGHIKGDETLIAVTSLITRHFDDEHTRVYRYGGDEFVVIVHSHKPKAINARVTALQNELYEKNLPNEHSYCADRLSLSIGAAHIRLDLSQLSLSECLHRADIALYQAKRRGRNMYVEQKYGS